MARIRRKLGAGAAVVKTMRGMGYALDGEEP